jgi:hypothetical protein
MKIILSNFLSLFLLLTVIVVILCSCQEKNDPINGQVNIIISGLELLDPLIYPASRIKNESIWEQKFEHMLALTFESDTGEKFALEINPNDFSIPYSIALPVGNYDLIGSSVSTDSFVLLPLRVAQKLSVNSAVQNLTIRATSDFGLFTITNENLGTSRPEDLLSNRKLELNGKFYYRYAPLNTDSPIKIPLANDTNSFNLNWKPKPFTHRHLSLDNPADPNDVNVFTPRDFAIDQSQLLLSEKGLPTALSPIILAELPNSQNETSGLAFIQDRLFSINDGGNSNEIYELNPVTGAVIRTIRVTNATNNDWEELAQSDTHLFIGDFGNNNGTRKNLALLKIPIFSVLGSNEVIAEQLRFCFADQTDFSGDGGLNNYDCEAFFFSDNLLHLFTKNRGDGKTNHYTLDPSQSNSLAILNGSFDVKGLITAAGIDSQGNICLLGYEDAGFTSRSFVWLFSGYSGTAYLSGKSTRIFLGSPSLLSQTEGLIFEADGQVMISGERISVGGLTIPAKLSKIDLRGLF